MAHIGTNPAEYRDTELEPLPERWQLTPLNEMATLVSDKTEPSDARGMPYVGLEHIDSGNPRLMRVGNPEEVRSTKGVFCEQDVLYGKLRPYLDKAVLAPCSGICSTDILILRAKAESCDPRFLAFALHCYPFLQHAINTTTGTNHPRTSWAKIGSFRFMLPPLPEQQKIAAVLGAVQEAKERTEAVIQAAKELKKSLLRYLFTYGPVPVDEAENVPLKETEVGDLREDWEVVDLADLVAEGPQNGIYKPQSDYGQGSPILRIDDYENEGGLVTGASRRVSLSEDEIEKYGLQPGDILVNRVNSLTHLGKTALVGDLSEAVVFESNMMRFRVNGQKVTPEYIFRFLTSPMSRRQMREKAKRAVAQSSINQGDVKSLKVPCPPLSVQRLLTDALDAADRRFAAELDTGLAFRAMFVALLRSLMTARIRVDELPLEELDLKVPA
ncbi:MAG: restriction endonuclease subunit S [Planctomycetota bacterium]